MPMRGGSNAAPYLGIRRQNCSTLPSPVWEDLYEYEVRRKRKRRVRRLDFYVIISIYGAMIDIFFSFCHINVFHTSLSIVPTRERTISDPDCSQYVFHDVPKKMPGPYFLMISNFFFCKRMRKLNWTRERGPCWMQQLPPSKLAFDGTCSFSVHCYTLGASLLTPSDL